MPLLLFSTLSPPVIVIRRVTCEKKREKKEPYKDNNDGKLVKKKEKKKHTYARRRTERRKSEKTRFNPFFLSLSFFSSYFFSICKMYEAFFVRLDEFQLHRAAAAYASVFCNNGPSPRPLPGGCLDWCGKGRWGGGGAVPWLELSNNKKNGRFSFLLLLGCVCNNNCPRPSKKCQIY